MDCYSSIWRGIQYDWQNLAEIFVVCRRCHRPSIQIVSQRETGEPFRDLCKKRNKLASVNVALNDIVKFERMVTLRDNHHFEIPDHIPEPVASVLEEANSCLASECFNAAAAMYRLALDIATKQKLPSDGEPNSKIRRSLGLRLEWMFETQVIPLDLHELAKCITQDGNDGAHDGTVGKEDAEDLQDFAFELLRRLFTEPERLRLAQQRRTQRRTTA